MVFFYFFIIVFLQKTLLNPVKVYAKKNVLPVLKMVSSCYQPLNFSKLDRRVCAVLGEYGEV